MAPVLNITVVSEEEKRMQNQLQLEIQMNALQRECMSLDAQQTRLQTYGASKLAKGARVGYIYQKEYENIAVDLEVATSKERKREDAKMFDRLTKTVQSYSYFKDAVVSEKKYITEIEGQVKVVKKSIEDLRKAFTTEEQYLERVKAACITYEKVENKLEVEMKKFNVICAKNARFRIEIDHLLWDRKNFMGVWDKMMAKLCSGKQIMIDLIEQATLAYDQREDWCNKLQALRIKGHRELTANVDEMRRLTRETDNSMKMEQFYTTKGQKRVMNDLRKKLELKRLELKKKLRERLDSYEEMLVEIKQFARENDTNTIAVKYSKQEERNFMFFKYINDMIEEAETGSEDLSKLHEEISQEQLLHEERANQQEVCLEDLKHRLEKVTKGANNSEQHVNNLNTALDYLMGGIWKLFKISKCNQDPILKLLGDHTRITQHNVLLYLQLLERKIQESMVQTSLKDTEKRSKGPEVHRVLSSHDKLKLDMYGIDKIVPTNPCVLCVERELVADVIVKAQKVLTRKEIEEKLKQRLKQPEAKALIHNLSKCQLPRARHMMQRKFQ